VSQKIRHSKLPYNLATMFRFAWLSAFVVCALFPAAGFAQAGVTVIDQRAEYLFNDGVQFHADFETAFVIQEAYAFYQFSDNEQIWVYEGELANNQSFDVSMTFTEENMPRPYATIEYWFRFATDHGDIYESERYSFRYEDNRYVWQTLQRGPFTLYWHNGDAVFGEAVIAAAEQGVARVQTLLPLAAPQSVTLRVYDTVADVQMLAHQAGFAWQAGHTDPASGELLFSLQPGPQQSLEIQRQVPHEIAHLMLYQTFGAETYARFPAWLNEGIASNAEAYSDPTRTPLIQLAVESNAVIPFFSLCAAFPQDGESARLAYAQSASFVDYLHQNYNPTGFQLLVEAYAQNPDCVGATVETFGKDLFALEADWRASIVGEPDDLLSKAASLPWQVILSSAGIALVFLVALRLLSGRKR
jgi:hypothetical protein